MEQNCPSCRLLVPAVLIPGSLAFPCKVSFLLTVETFYLGNYQTLFLSLFGMSIFPFQYLQNIFALIIHSNVQLRPKSISSRFLQRSIAVESHSLSSCEILGWLAKKE
ncbi:hypothetical protein Tco_0478835 [Tanacetum coccineum]